MRLPKPGSATPLLQFSITHGGDAARQYDGLAKMSKKVAKDTYRDVELTAFAGAKKGYRYTDFGRHYLALLLDGNSDPPAPERLDRPRGRLSSTHQSPQISEQLPSAYHVALAPRGPS